MGKEKLKYIGNNFKVILSKVFREVSSKGRAILLVGVFIIVHLIEKAGSNVDDVDDVIVLHYRCIKSFITNMRGVVVMGKLCIKRN